MSSHAPLIITMFGEFSVACPDTGKVLTERDTRSRKVLSLLAYLITFRQREVPRQELFDMLWPGEGSDDPGNALKTLIHRARSALGETGFADCKAAILSRSGFCAWNEDVPVQVDAEEFERLLTQAQGLTPEGALILQRQALSLYKGQFLPNAAADAWVVPISAYYHSQYLNAAHSVVEKLSGQGRFDEVIELCQSALAIDPYDEPLHAAMIRALVAGGMQQRALQHYTYATELFMNGFGISPSEELTALYKEVVKTVQSTETNLHIIRQDLRENRAVEGAFFCEYAFFRDIYRLEARAALRSGQVVHVALLTLLNDRGKPMTPKQINLTMERLWEVISQSLRTGDTFCRYSVSQFLLMLPSASLENSNRVLRRISGNFKQRYPHMDVMLHYSCLPVEPQ